jgi:hypothetical protein
LTGKSVPRTRSREERSSTGGEREIGAQETDPEKDTRPGLDREIRAQDTSRERHPRNASE